MRRTPRILLSSALTTAFLLPVLTIVTSTSADAATRPLLAKCGDPVGFETSNEDWRVQSFMTGGTPGVITPYGAADWIDSDGDPSPGALQVPDVDGAWTEVVTPVLAPNFSTDYTSLLGRTVTFSYKYQVAGQSITNNVYVALRGANGDAVYFPFKDQTAPGGGWATVTVPLDASQWLDDFTFAAGPGGAAPSSSEFAAILAELDEVAFSMEGSNVQNDLTLLDNFAIDCGGATQPAVTCDTGITFDTDNQGWRQQSFMTGGVAGAVTAYGEATWISGDGDPSPGSLQVPDVDGAWTELVTPSLGLTNAADYSSLVGNDLTFSYKYDVPGQQVTNHVYIVLRSTTGDAVYFPFEDQVGPSGSWATVTAALDASQWLADFTFDDGPVGSAPSDASFAAILADLDEIGFSMEGSNVQNDVTLFDNLQIDCDPDDPSTPTDPDLPAPPDTGLPHESAWLPIAALALGALAAGGAGVALRRRN